MNYEQTYIITGTHLFKIFFLNGAKLRFNCYVDSGASE